MENRVIDYTKNRVIDSMENRAISDKGNGVIDSMENRVNDDPENRVIYSMENRVSDDPDNRVIDSIENSKSVLEKYELGETLGRGSFSKVKYARHIETGQSFAIKIIDKQEMLTRNISQSNIRTEVSIMKRLKHPNIVQLYEVLESTTKIYLVLEYAPGGTLFTKISQEGKLKEAIARKYFHQLMDAVEHCHSLGVYHRDLKPENLLLDSEGNLKVSDFGLSASSEQIRSDGLLHTYCGSIEYMAPEVLNSSMKTLGYDGAKADVWSCGVILYVFLVGYTPFHDSNLPSLLTKINRARFACPFWMPHDAVRLIRLILNPSPKYRLTLAEIRKDPWFRKGNKMTCSLDKVNSTTNVKIATPLQKQIVHCL